MKRAYEGAVFTQGMPEGWLARVEWRELEDGPRPFYRAYRWRKVERKATRKLWQAKLQLSGWKRTTIVHRHLGDTLNEVIATIRAEAGATK